MAWLIRSYARYMLTVVSCNMCVRSCNTHTALLVWQAPARPAVPGCVLLHGPVRKPCCTLQVQHGNGSTQIYEIVRITRRGPRKFDPLTCDEDAQPKIFSILSTSEYG